MLLIGMFSHLREIQAQPVQQGLQALPDRRVLRGHRDQQGRMVATVAMVQQDQQDRLDHRVQQDQQDPEAQQGLQGLRQVLERLLLQQDLLV